MVRWIDPVAAALDAAPRLVPVFFRDDDAGWSDDRLCVLLDRFLEYGLPLDVAVIPKALRPPLARELRARADERLSLHQHGFAHANHEPEGRKFEFGPSRSRAEQRRDIEAGRALLEERLGGLLAPIFSPPWNRCTAETGKCLAELGFTVLSRESRAEPLGVPGLRELPVSLDFVRLEPDELARRFAAARPPVGVMFHHAEMDDAAMARAGELLELLAGHDRVAARPMMALV
jgi:Uncharacterized protein conserved in bacteria (DUF2334)